MKTQTVLKSVVAGALMLGLASVASAGGMPGKAKSVTGMAKPMAGMEKCYGINAAYKNDCHTIGHSCAGQDKMAHDPNAFVAVPKGLCQKIGGKLTPAQKG